MGGDLLLTGLNLATMVPDAHDPFGLVEDAAVAIERGLVTYAGPASGYRGPMLVVADMGGRFAFPGFVASHNSVCWAGDATSGDGRSRKRDGSAYRLRVKEVIDATASADNNELVALMTKRLDRLMRSGVTAFELKSGFGRSARAEVDLTLLCRGYRHPTGALTSVTLAAGNVVADGVNTDDHLEDLVTVQMPRAYEALAFDTVEVFCDDEAGVDLDIASTVLEAFYRKRSPTKVSCDRFIDSAGATLPASFYSRAATYLCCSDEPGIETIAAVGSTFILVPETMLQDERSHLPALAAMRRSGARIAVCCEAGPDGGDLDIVAAARLGIELYGLTPVEALHGITINAAHALGLQERVGSIAQGKRGDLALFDIDHPEALFGASVERCSAVVICGQVVGF